MSVWAVVLIGFGVSADAFAVALTSGLKMRRLNYRHAVVIAVTFAVFQALMPLLGWLLASRFAQVLGPVDHWIAFGILTAIGAKMVWDAFTPDEDEEAHDDKLNVRRLLLLGVATSIDAAAVGVSLAVMAVSIVQAMLIIGYITLTLSFLAVLIGHRVGIRFRAPAEAIGGLMLVAIGVRILLEHLQLF